MNDYAKSYAAIENAFRDWLLGGIASSDIPMVSVSQSGSLLVDREALHASKAYSRQLEALKELEEKLREQLDETMKGPPALLK